MGDPELAAASARWDHGYCPWCGSWPAFIENTVMTGGGEPAGSGEGVSRHGALRCSYCAAAWELTTTRCVYCATADERFIVAGGAAPAVDADKVDQPCRRVELCGACGAYTKLITSASLTPFPLLAIEDLATLELDEGAMARGYRRPDLFDLDTIDPPASPTCG